MKLILPLLLLVCAPFAGLAVETFVIGPSLEPDAEAVTNVPVVVNMERLKTCAASISFEASEANEVLIALGCDTNADGDLDFDEADLVFGCDCSNWYSADLRTWTMNASFLEKKKHSHRIGEASDGRMYFEGVQVNANP